MRGAIIQLFGLHQIIQGAYDNMTTSGDIPSGYTSAPPWGQIRRYRVPARLTPEEKFDHWRSWLGSAVVAPVRLERTSAGLRPGFNPSATSSKGQGFSFVELKNEPATVHWQRDSSSEDIRLVHFSSPALRLNFLGRSEVVTPGTVRFLDLSSHGFFHAPVGMHSLHITFDRSFLGVDEGSLKHLLVLPNVQEHPLVKSLIVPTLGSWQRNGLEREFGRLQPVVRSVMSALAASLLETRIDSDDISLARLAAVKNYVRKNYRNQNLDAETVVTHSLLSRRTVYYLFEGEQWNLYGYIRALRTLKAVDFLSSTGCRKNPSLAEIAQASGFTNLQAMRRAVKEIAGLTLREVQENPEPLDKRVSELRKSLEY